MKKPHYKKSITFEEIFDPTLRERIRLFLERDDAAANLTRAVLLTAAMGGVFAVGVMAPNLFRVFGGNTFRGNRSRRLNLRGYYAIRKTFYAMRRARIIEPTSNRNDNTYRLSKIGLAKLETLLKRTATIPNPSRWDRKWRLIFFDIPMTHHTMRDRFRKGLRTLGCRPMQKSVWVHPFPCSRDVLALADAHGLASYVEIYTVEDFDRPDILEAFRTLVTPYT